MKKLLYIATNLNGSGGVARVLSIKLNYLVHKYGYEIFIINTYGNTDNLFYEFDERIVIQSLNQDRSSLKRFLCYTYLLNAKIKAINPDIIVNCDNGVKGVLFPFIYSGKIPLIFESHSSKYVTGETRIENLILRLRDFIFSKSVKKYRKIIVFKFLENNWQSENIKVIHNPLTFSLTEDSSHLDNNIALAVGRLSYEKGYDLLIKVWSLVLQKLPNWELHIYGAGHSGVLMREINKFNISESVKLFKPTLNIREVYLSSSLLLNSSREESFGMTLIEAMSCGLPVFAFENTDGPKIFIKNNENGFLIEKDNLKAYADQVVALINNKDEMKRIGGNAKASLKAYQKDSIMQKWHKLFQSIS